MFFTGMGAILIGGIVAYYIMYKVRKNDKTRIHVNQHKIRSNIKKEPNDPVITVKTSKSVTYTHEVEIKGQVKLSIADKLSCGARGMD